MPVIKNISTNRILSTFKDAINEKNARRIVPAAIIGTWGLQTGMEVKNAVPEHKKNAFISNLIIGVSMFAGGFLGHKAYARYANKQVVVEQVKKLSQNPIIKNTPNKIKELFNKIPKNEFLHAFSIPVSAGLAGGIGGEIAQRMFPVEYKTPEKILEKAHKFIDMDSGLIQQMEDIPGFDLIDMVHPSGGTIIGYSIGKEKGVKNKVKKFVFEMISGVVAPLALIMPVNSILRKKMPDKKTLRTVATVGAGISATFVGNTVAQWFNKKYVDKIVEHKWSETFAAKQRQLAKIAVFTNDPHKKQLIQKQINKLQKVKQNIDKTLLAATPINTQKT